MKLYRKSKLKVRDGLIVTKKGKVIALGADVVDQAIRLDRFVAMLKFMAHQPTAIPERSLDGFWDGYGKTGWHYEFEADFPALDGQRSEAAAMLGDLRRRELVRALNEAVGACGRILAALDSEYLGGEVGTSARLAGCELLGPQGMLDLSADEVLDKVREYAQALDADEVRECLDAAFRPGPCGSPGAARAERPDGGPARRAALYREACERLVEELGE